MAMLTKPVPLLVWPSFGVMGPDAWFKNNSFVATVDRWDKPGWAAAVTFVTGEGEQSGNCLRMNPAASAQYCNQGDKRLVTGKLVAGSSRKHYFVARVKCKAGTGSATLWFELRFYDSAGTYQSSQRIGLSPGGTDLPADNTWRVYVLDNGTVPSGTAYVQVFLGNIYANDTFDVYFDWVGVGFLTQFETAMTPYPVRLAAPTNDKETDEHDLNETEDGGSELVQWQRGLRNVEIETTPFDTASRAAWIDFWQQVNAGCPFTVIPDVTQGVAHRHFLESCAVDQDGDGVLQVAGGWHRVKMKVAELPTANKPGVGRNLMVVKFKAALSGGGDLNFTTGTVLSGLTGTTYPHVRRKDCDAGGQKVDDLESTTEWPDATIVCLDENGEIEAAVVDNDDRIYNSVVEVWIGKDDQAFGSFDRVFIGKLADADPDGLDYVFRLQSIFDELDNPIDYKPGTFEIQTAVTAYDTNYFKVKNAVNLTQYGGNVFNASEASFESGTLNATPTGWTDDGSGKIVKQTNGGNPKDGTYVAENTDAGTTERSLYKDYTTPKVGCTYTLSGWLNSDTTSTGSGRLYVEALDGGGSVLQSWDLGQQSPAVGGAGDLIWQKWQQYILPITPSVTGISKFRVYVKLTNQGGDNMCWDGIVLSVGTLAVVNRETVAISSYVDKGSQTGRLFVARGLYGSLRHDHAVDDEGYTFVSLRGHVCDVIRRLILTTTAGTNGSYDAGDGFGLGSLIADEFINHTNFDAWRAFKSSGTPNPFNEYDVTKYWVSLELEVRIDSLWQTIVEMLLKPFYAFLYQDGTGKLCIHFPGCTYAADGSTLPRSSLVPGDDLPGMEFPHDKIKNRVVYNADYDDCAAVDYQGNQAGGTRKFIYEGIFDEGSFGHDAGDSAKRSFDKYGTREHVIEARALRGIASARMGMSSYLSADQVAFEVARRIITRRRFPLSKWSEIETTWAKRGLAMCALPAVTSNNLRNRPAKAWGRTAATMEVVGKSVVIGESRGVVDLEAVCDIVAIPNTTAASVIGPPAVVEWSLVSRTLSGTGANFNDAGEQYKGMDLWPKGYANIGWVNLYSGFGSAPVASSVPVAPTDSNYLSTLVYAARALVLSSEGPAWSSATTYAIGNLVTTGTTAGGISIWKSLQNSNLNHTPAEGAWWTAAVLPDSAFELVAEIPAGGVDTFFLFAGCSSLPASYTQKVYVRLKYRNKDRQPSATFSDCKVLTAGSNRSYGVRNYKKGINQMSSTGVRDTGFLGPPSRV